MIHTGGDLFRLQLYILWEGWGQDRMDFAQITMGAMKAPIFMLKYEN